MMPEPEPSEAPPATKRPTLFDVEAAEAAPAHRNGNGDRVGDRVGADPEWLSWTPAWLLGEVDIEADVEVEVIAPIAEPAVIAPIPEPQAAPTPAVAAPVPVAPAVALSAPPADLGARVRSALVLLVVVISMGVLLAAIVGVIVGGIAIALQNALG